MMFKMMLYIDIENAIGADAIFSVQTNDET